MVYEPLDDRVVSIATTLNDGLIVDDLNVSLWGDSHFRD